MKMKWLCIACGVLLLLAIPTGWPYDFYTLLRWFIFGVSVYVAYGFYKSNLPSWALIFGGMSLLFNPIVPFYLSKSSWVLIDFVSSILFFLAAYSIKEKRS